MPFTKPGTDLAIAWGQRKQEALEGIDTILLLAKVARYAVEADQPDLDHVRSLVTAAGLLREEVAAMLALADTVKMRSAA